MLNIGNRPLLIFKLDTFKNDKSAQMLRKIWSNQNR